MEVSIVRKRVLAAIADARRRAGERRARADAASMGYETFLSRVAVPVARQLVGALRAEGIAFTLSTPGDGVRLTVDRGRDDYVELTLATDVDPPQVVGRTRHTRGSRTEEDERPVKPGALPTEITEQDLLDFLVAAVDPWLAR